MCGFYFGPLISLNEHSTVNFFIVCSMNTVFDFQKPTDEKLSKWAGLLRSHESMLKKYVSLYTILFFGVTK